MGPKVGGVADVRRLLFSAAECTARLTNALHTFVLIGMLVEVFSDAKLVRPQALQNDDTASR